MRVLLRRLNDEYEGEADNVSYSYEEGRGKPIYATP